MSDFGPVIGAVDIREVRNCVCLRVRRTARRITQVYDQALAPAGLTIGQMGLLSALYGALVQTGGGLPVKALAEMIDLDPTTLNRNLKPLEASGFIDSRPDRADRRIRSLRITRSGRAKLAQATGLWRQAQESVRARIGAPAMLELDRVLDRTVSRL